MIDKRSNDLIFIFGHEAAHGENQADVNAKLAALDTASYAPGALPKTAKSYNATQYVNEYVKTRLGNEGLANIKGWNDVVQREQVRLGVTSLNQEQLNNLIKNANYSDYFFDRNTGMYKPGFSKGGLSLGMIDPALASNVDKALADQGGRKPSNGENNYTYRQEFVASALNKAISAANGRPVIIDFEREGLLVNSKEDTITPRQALDEMRAAGLGKSSQGSYVIQDSSSGKTFTVARSADGVRITQDPTAAPVGTPPEQVRVVVVPNQPTIVERWVNELFEVKPISGAQIGQILGSTLGRQIAGDDKIAQIGAGSVIGSLGAALGAAFDAAIGSDVSFGKALSAQLSNLPEAIGLAGVGAVSSALYQPALITTHVPICGARWS